jgi:hypothetical protein
MDKVDFVMDKVDFGHVTRWGAGRVRDHRCRCLLCRLVPGKGGHPTPYSLHPTPYTLHPTPYTLHPTPYTLHPTHYTLNQTPASLLRRPVPGGLYAPRTMPDAGPSGCACPSFRVTPDA